MSITFNPMPKEGNSNKFYLSMDVFYLYLAGFITAIPTLRSFMDELYETNKIAFHEKAKNSSYTNATFMTDRPLDNEVSMRRAFGIFLYADEDEQIQDAICKAIIKYNKAWGVFAKSYTWDQLASFYKGQINAATNTEKSFDELNAPLYLVAYIVYCKHGIAKKEKIAVKQLHDIVAKDIAKRESFAQNKYVERIDKYSTDRYEETRPLRDYKTALRLSRGLYSLFSAAEAIDFGKDAITTSAQKIVKILSKFPVEDQESAVVSSFLIGRVFSLYGLSVSQYSEKVHFSEEEIERIYKIVAISSDTRKTNKLESINVSDLTQALWFAMTAKLLIENREFYFKNNSETQFFELRDLEREVQRLQEALADQRNAAVAAMSLAAAHNEQIKLLNAELAKENKDAAKPLLAEIAMLRSQISDMQARLDAESEKAKELYRLREFVFGMQQVGDIQVEEVSLDKLIAGKKIYIFGGHINWRTRLKQKYPKLDVLDGHNTSFDAQKLIGADMVLLNTSNMSHDLYYKVIDVLRKHSIPFDYLGKYSNPNLLEKEISEILLMKTESTK